VVGGTELQAPSATARVNRANLFMMNPIGVVGGQSPHAA